MSQENSQATVSSAQKSGLGFAGLTAKAFIHSPLSPLPFLAMLGMGLLGLMVTPRQEDPQISVPMIDIFVQYPGASTDQVVSLAVEPLERLFAEIPGVKHVYSAAEREQGIITVRFKVGEQMGPSLVKVHDKLQANQHIMPPGTMQPMVKPKGIDDVPAVTLTLWSDAIDDAALRSLASKLLQNLAQIPDTGQGFVVGGRSEQIRVQVEPQRLSGYGVTLDAIAQTIQTANAERRTGNVEAAEEHLTVYTGSFLQTASDVERLMVGTHAGAPVYVRDVATVSLAPREYHQQVNYYTGPSYPGEASADGMPAVTIAIAKKEGSNGVTVANAILDKVERLRGQLVPDNVQVEVTRNYGESANDKVNELIFKLFVATGAVTVLVLLALGLKPAIVVTLVIPVVLLMTVFSAWLMGYSIDRVSLFALIFSIGILVDDAIVVVENIYRRWLIKGETDTETAVAAVAEVGNPTIIATFTVVAALLPMGFVSGLMGPYMQPIPALGSAAMLFSLFAAFAFTPWLAMRIKPSMKFLEKAERKEHRTAEALDGLFRRVLLPLIERKSPGYLFLFGLIGAFFASMLLFYVKAVPFKMLPFDNKPEFSVVLDMALGDFKAGDIKRGNLLEPTFIVLEVPLAVRAQLNRLADLPIPTMDGRILPLAEVGRFVRVDQDPIVYHKDLRAVEYVVGDAVGRLGAPLYPMLAMEDKLADYTTPDGEVISGTFFTGPPPDNGKSGFEWGGEWTVTYETFRDMGLAFAVALILIYMLVVGEFGNFVTPGVIMAPIPLTLLGIVPGHWVMGADFTATSMIGFIALAGIIVRNSILLVDFSIDEVEKGASVKDAVINACKARTRPILITALALVAGSSVILTDPIFQGMAISLLFGVMVSTVLTLVVIPLGCVSAGKHLVRR